MKYKPFLCIALIALNTNVEATLSAISINNFSTPILDNLGNELLAGSDANGDGYVIQVGYFSSDANNFTGDFMAITGDGSANIRFNTSIGDGGGPNGLFTVDFTLDNTIDTVPAGGTQLALRFFDSDSVNTAQHFNTVTDTSWTLNSFSESVAAPRVIDLATGSIVWQDNANAFITSIVAIPEPSSSVLLGLGGLAFVLRRRR